MESFMLAFDTNLKPSVGQQVTLNAGRYDDPSLVALLAAAERDDCDLALRQDGRGWVVVQPNAAAPASSWVRDRRGTRRQLRELSSDAGPMTFTCHPHQREQAEARRAAFQRSQPAR
jgi:hypothetical protein